MYLRNSWYVIAWSKEIAEKPLSRRVLGELIVVYRSGSGEVAALADRCPHRHVPLSMGTVQGEHLQCGYHGLRFDGTGACVSVPTQTQIPPKACVRSYPTEEKYGWIWVWMGDAKLADPKAIPDFHQLSSPEYAAVGKTNHVQCHYRYVTDNLLDLSHVGFVHTSTIGNSGMGEKGQLRVSKDDNRLTITRMVPDVPPPPTYVKSGVLPEGKNIDRWQIIEFLPPCFVKIHVGGAEAGTGALEGRFEHGLNAWVLNAQTPETDTTTHYFWASVRNHAVGDPAVDELFFNQVSEAFEEDKQILEAQQRSLSELGADSWDVTLRADAGVFQAKRLLEQCIRDEQGIRPVARREA